MAPRPERGHRSPVVDMNEIEGPREIGPVAGMTALGVVFSPVRSAGGTVKI